MNIEDKALDIILDHTSSSEWEDVCKLTWNTDEVQELLIKALKQGQTLPIDSVSKCDHHRSKTIEEQRQELLGSTWYCTKE
tara:strand:+ start:2741 stop:2983 length:243 start_codon:yes stop_codon:yes gene_type:complete